MSLPKAQLVDPQGNMNVPGMNATGVVTATSLDGLSTDYTTGGPYVMYSGTPYVHMMIPLENYYDYQPESNPKNN